MNNAIIFYVVPTFRLTGSTINAIEYFLAGFEYNDNLKLVLLNGTKRFKNQMMNMMTDRYIWDGLRRFEFNIVCLGKADLLREEFDNVLVLDYMTIKQTKGIIRAKNLMVISEKYTDKREYFYDKSLYPVTYYGEMPFHYKDIEYRMKCLFDRYKPLRNVKKGTYINSPRNDSFFDDLDSNCFFIKEKYIHLPEPFIFKSKTKPRENLFEQFTHYLYYHADKWFDPHPRLFLECGFYNKVMTYVNEHEIKDGSWYRYQDWLENKLWDRTLNRNDQIIRQLI